MKTIYALSLLLLIAAFSTNAQEVVYQHSISSSTTALSNGLTSSTNSWAVYHTGDNGNSSNTSSSAYLKTTKNLNTLELKGVPVEGLTDVTVSWAGRSIKASPIKLYYKINYFTASGTETEVSSLHENTNSNGWQHINTGAGIQLPAQVKNAYTLDLKWTVKVEGHQNKNAYYAMDEIVVKGNRDRSIKPMPVKMTFFEGQVQEGSVRLNWRTALERDNDKFVIERSLDGIKFSKIGEVKGSSNSLASMDYSYSDTAPAAGTNYYRLRQVDLDGKEALSYVVAIEVAAVGQASAQIATVYPTVANQSISISLNITGSATISVLDASGTPVTTLSITSEHEVVLPVQALKSGVYFVKVTDGQSQKTQRFIKQ